MKYRFEVTYVPFEPCDDPEQDMSCSCSRQTIERTVHESVPFDIVRQQIAFELEEQHIRVLTIQGETVE